MIQLKKLFTVNTVLYVLKLPVSSSGRKPSETFNHSIQGELHLYCK